MKRMPARLRGRDYLAELQSLLYAAPGLGAVVEARAMAVRDSITVTVGAGVHVAPDAGHRAAARCPARPRQ
ncbi:hypothetical protein AB0H83_44860 [Dactylosporangium sp. NPDC050688]|uniref:hypothetical protein n=1 Tax=Dactylosporangium sp. NPDC050688 TaxID=3157217 RepID=UPI003403BF3E